MVENFISLKIEGLGLGRRVPESESEAPLFPFLFSVTVKIGFGENIGGGGGKSPHYLFFPLHPRDIIFNALPLCARTGKWEMGKEGIMGGV